MLPKKLLISIGIFTFITLSFRLFQSGPGLPMNDYAESEVGSVLSQNNTGRAISSVVMHGGYLFVPMGTDNGGGVGSGAFNIYDVTDMTQPQLVFRSLDYHDIYHKNASFDFVGNWAEIHALPIIDSNYMVISERGSRGGFSIFDPTPAYDDDSTTLPRIVSRFYYPGVNGTTNYDGYSFSLATYGGRYVYSPTGNNGLYITDISNIEQPVIANHIANAQLSNVLARTATVIGNWLILSDSQVGAFSNVIIMDLSDPIHPVQIGKIEGVKLGYQPILYGSEFFPIDDGPLYSYDFQDPQNITIKQYNQFAGDLLLKPEYGFGKDDFIFIGHYPGMTKWSLTDIDGPVVSRVNPIAPSSDDYAFITPLGNVIAVTSDHNHQNKLNFGVHEAEADRQPPLVKFVVPKDQTSNVSLQNGFGISFTDFIDAESIDETTLYLSKLGSDLPIHGSYSQLFGYVNFYPNEDLEENTTYQVKLKAGGVRDWSNNSVEQDQIVTTFSTGSGLIIAPILTAQNPSLVNENVTFVIDTSNSSNENTFEYSIDFGDGSTASPFSTNLEVPHIYNAPGNYTVTLNTRINNNLIVQSTINKIAHKPISDIKPIHSSTIIIDEDNQLVWNVNPDNNTVSAIDLNNLQLKYEIPVGKNPNSLAFGNNNLLYVINKDDASLSIINRLNGVVMATHFLPYGSWPSGIICNTSENVAYITLEAKAELLKISLQDYTTISSLEVANTPTHLAFDQKNKRLLISHFISPDDAGKISLINTESFLLEKVIDLALDNTPDDETNGRGLPNYLGALAISPDLTQAYVPSKKDNILRGKFRDGEDLNFEHTVRSIASQIDLNNESENLNKRIDFDNDDFATAAAYSPLGNQVFITTNGTSRIHVIDAYNPQNRSSINSNGQAPRGIAISKTGNQMYVHNYMSRSVSVFENEENCTTNCGTFRNIAVVKVVSHEQLSNKVLLGKQLFYNSVDTRLAQDGYMSCASCHLNGGSDGRVWDLGNLGEGLRNTIDLRGKLGMSHGPLHWTANFDEVQDFENQIRLLNSGTGLMTDEDFAATEFPLGEKKTGKSADLDALAAYVNSLNNVLKSPYTNNGTLSPMALEGKAVFDQLACDDCHGGPLFTNSKDEVLYDIGTIKPTSGNRLGGALLGFDVPTLRGLWFTAPYLHDGSAPTIKAAIEAHQEIEITEDELTKLEAYLLQLDNSQCDIPLGTICDDGNPQTENDAFNENCICQGELVECIATGQMIYEQWNNINGKKIEGLIEDASYPYQPSSSIVLTNLFESNQNQRDQFGQKISGILCAPASGSYKFYLSGNDESALYLSMDEDFNNVVQIAHIPESTFFRQWYKYSSQISEPIELQEGKQYYIYAISKDGLGDDHLSVGWQLPNGDEELPMSLEYCSLPETYDCNSTYLSDILWEGEAINGLGPIELDASNGEIAANDGNPMNINGIAFKKGLGTHAHSKVTYLLDGNYDQFSAYIGLQSHCGFGSVEFKVKVDDALVYDSGIMFVNDNPKFIGIDISNASKLDLIVNQSILGNTCDHANWADAKLTKCVSCNPGVSCNDEEDCTVNDIIDLNCNCVGELLDTNSNNICDLDEVPTSLNINSEPTFNLYPNPVKDYLSIAFEQMDEIECIKIYDVLGQQVLAPSLSYETNSMIRLNLSELVSGNYFVRIFTELDQFTQKVVKH